MTSEQQLKKLLADRSVKRGIFTLASGKVADVYVDARITTMSAEGLTLVGNLGLQAIRSAGWTPDTVGGLTLGADPIAYAISMASYTQPPQIDAFTIRKETKMHGTGKLIEGAFKEGHRVVIIEDVITTGGSALKGIEAISNAGGYVEGVLAIVDRGDEGIDAIRQRGHSVISLIQLSDILNLVPLQP